MQNWNEYTDIRQWFTLSYGGCETWFSCSWKIERWAILFSRSCLEIKIDLTLPFEINTERLTFTSYLCVERTLLAKSMKILCCFPIMLANRNQGKLHLAYRLLLVFVSFHISMSYGFFMLKVFLLCFNKNSLEKLK